MSSELFRACNGEGDKNIRQRKISDTGIRRGTQPIKLHSQ